MCLHYGWLNTKLYVGNRRGTRYLNGEIIVDCSISIKFDKLFRANDWGVGSASAMIIMLLVIVAMMRVITIVIAQVLVRMLMSMKVVLMIMRMMPVMV